MNYFYECPQCRFVNKTGDCYDRKKFNCQDCGFEFIGLPATESALDTQVGGDHYKDLPSQPVEYIEANQLRFLEGCIVKRATRHDKPTGKGREDIEKIIHEAQLILELRYQQESTK